MYDDVILRVSVFMVFSKYKRKVAFVFFFFFCGCIQVVYAHKVEKEKLL